MDLLVEETVIVEVKSVEKNHPVHAKQLRTHLVLARLQLGLVLNFGLERMADGITRIVNGLPENLEPNEKAGWDFRAETRRAQRNIDGAKNPEQL
jgi:hypothetical protein